MSVLHAALRARAAAAPNEVLLDDGASALSAAATLASVDALASVLAGFGPSLCVASRLDNGIDAVILDLALRAIGAVHVPVPPYFSAAQMAHVLEQAAVTLCVLPASAPMPGALWHETGLPLAPGLRAWRREVIVATAPRWPTGTACISFTSGTTAEPKGVCLSEQSLVAVASSLASATQSLQLRRHLCALPLATLLESVGVYAALLASARIQLPRLADLGYSGATGLDPARLRACIERHQPDSLILVPQLLDGLLGELEQGAPLSTPLRFVAVGGARVAPRLHERALEQGLPVYEGYGLSECASVVCLNRPGASRPGSVGRPLPHAQVRVDAQGEVHVRGALALGYLGEPARPGEEIATGDLGWLDADGFLHLHGRRRNVFITSYGRNLSPEWIEAELTASPLIAQAVVDGEARADNLAIVVPAQAAIERAAIEAELQRIHAGLPDYARIGRLIIAAAPFSLGNGLATGNGRPRRAAVLRHYAAQIAELDRQATASDDSVLQGQPA